MRHQLYDYVAAVIKGQGGVPLAVNGMADHLHALAKLRQDVAVAAIVRDVKANSSHWLRRQESQAKFAWQGGYGAFSVCESQVDRVRLYVVNQETHHRRMSFEEEFEA